MERGNPCWSGARLFFSFKNICSAFWFPVFSVAISTWEICLAIDSIFFNRRFKKLVASAPASDCWDFTLSYFVLFLVFVFQDASADGQGSPHYLWLGTSQVQKSACRSYVTGQNVAKAGLKPVGHIPLRGQARKGHKSWQKHAGLS